MPESEMPDMGAALQALIDAGHSPVEIAVAAATLVPEEQRANLAARIQEAV